MAQLIVRNIDPALVRALKIQAVRHHRSAEAEHREILQRALGRGARTTFKQHLQAMPNVGRDADFNAPRPRARRVKL